MSGKSGFVVVSMVRKLSTLNEIREYNGKANKHTSKIFVDVVVAVVGFKVTYLPTANCSDRRKRGIV